MAAHDTIITSIKVALAVRGKNQAALASDLEVSRAWGTDRIVGRTKLSTDDLERIGEALEVRVSDLTSGVLIPAELAGAAEEASV